MRRLRVISAALSVSLALALGAASASASAIPGTLYQADLSGSGTIQAVSTGVGGLFQYTITGTFPLDGTTNPKLNPVGAQDPAGLDIWIPTAASAPSSTIVYPTHDPDFDTTPTDSSLTAVENPALTETDPNAGADYSIWQQNGQDASSCPPSGTDAIDYALAPEIQVQSGGGHGASMLVKYNGNLYPQGGLTDQNGNANAINVSCLADFEVQTPQNFSDPWQAGEDTIMFAFSGASATAASQQLSGTSESQVAVPGGSSDSDTGMNCQNLAGSPGTGTSAGVTQQTCSEQFLNMSLKLTLTKVCSGSYSVATGPAGPYADGTCAGTSAAGTALTVQSVSASAHAVTIRAKCTLSAHGSCETESFVLHAKQPVAHGSPRTITIGRGSLTVPHGRSASLTLSISSAGRALARAEHGLSATLLVQHGSSVLSSRHVHIPA